MKLTFYGGANEVGRLCLLLEENEKNLMLDCGIKLGQKTELPLIHDDDLRNVRNVTVSHAHLDHSGYLPHLYAKNAKPNIFMTKPTRDLVAVLLADYQRLQATKEDRKLFSSKDVDGIVRDTKMMEYAEPFDADFKLTYFPAGHVLGSAITTIGEGDDRILFSGDICMRKTRVLDPCYRNITAKTLIVESTYGGKTDVIPSYKESYQKMISLINQTLDQGGHVVIPCFAVGRAQEILLALDDYMRSGALKPTKIFIEGMITKAMKIYRHNAIYANDDIKKRILMSEDDPFNSPNFHHSRSKTRKDVLSEPCIIVTTSGMLTGGPVLFYLEALGRNPKNTLIFVGYQAEGTLGNKICAGERRVLVGEREMEISMRVEQVRLSGHADFNELVQFVRSIKGLERIFLMHGEKGDLSDALSKDYQVISPKLLEVYDI
ncbi:MBL fold metallo-hydrolase [Candidatus Micrarchaeota archaeon]|nr:MBL fold metallo-hydrolase [Candidatus Micrarchaeota archaeon]